MELVKYYMVTKFPLKIISKDWLKYSGYTVFNKKHYIKLHPSDGKFFNQYDCSLVSPGYHCDK